MYRPACIGVELPCRRVIPAKSCALVLADDRPIYIGSPHPGRLCPPRRVAREVELLLKHHVHQARTEARRIGPKDPTAADALVKRANAWANGVRKQHLGPHRLRVQCDRFRAFDLPDIVYQLLVLQAWGTPRAGMPLLQVCIVVPVLPCLRLLDKVAVYLRAPATTTGQWLPLPEQLVQAELSGRYVLVLVSGCSTPVSATGKWVP